LTPRSWRASLSSPFRSRAGLAQTPQPSSQSVSVGAFWSAAGSASMPAQATARCRVIDGEAVFSEESVCCQGTGRPDYHTRASSSLPRGRGPHAAGPRNQGLSAVSTSTNGRGRLPLPQGPDVCLSQGQGHFIRARPRSGRYPSWSANDAMYRPWPAR
jgi:hypothetical protein